MENRKPKKTFFLFGFLFFVFSPLFSTNTVNFVLGMILDAECKNKEIVTFVYLFGNALAFFCKMRYDK